MCDVWNVECGMCSLKFARSLGVHDGEGTQQRNAHDTLYHRVQLLTHTLHLCSHSWLGPHTPPMCAVVCSLPSLSCCWCVVCAARSGALKRTHRHRSPVRERKGAQAVVGRGQLPLICDAQGSASTRSGDDAVTRWGYQRVQRDDPLNAARRPCGFTRGFSGW